MKYNELARKAHENSVNHGFWETKWSNEHCLCLIITEIAEMVEADRKGNYADLQRYEHESGKKPGRFARLFGKTGDAFESYVKNTVEDELADVAIRIGDLAGSLGVDFDAMQECRYVRSFDKFTFTENAFALAKGLSKDRIAIVKRLQFGLKYVEAWAKELGIDIDKFVFLKMNYNAKRAIRHGKKY